MPNRKINASNLPADIILSIVDFASCHYDLKDLHRLALQLSLVNRHWKAVVSDTAAYATATFSISRASDVKRLRRWLAMPLRKLTQRGNVTVNVFNTDIYELLGQSDRSLAKLNIATLNVNIHSDGVKKLLPRKLRAKYVSLSTEDAEQYLHPDSFTEDLRNNLRELQIEHLTPSGFHNLSQSQYNFGALTSFHFHVKWVDAIESGNLLKLMNFMPNLSTLDVAYIINEDYLSFSDDTPQLSLPPSMSKLASLKTRNVMVDIEKCSLPNLQQFDVTYEEDEKSLAYLSPHYPQVKLPLTADKLCSLKAYNASFDLLDRSLPNLKHLELRCNLLEYLGLDRNHYSIIRPYNPDCVLPTALDNLNTLKVSNVKVNLSQCSLSKLEHLEYESPSMLPDWGGLGSRLKVIDISYSNLASNHDLFKRETFQKLKTVRSFSMRGVKTSDIYDKLREGFFDGAMPLLERIDISTEYHDVGTAALNRFIDTHPMLNTVIAEGNDDICAFAVSSALERLVTKVYNGKRRCTGVGNMNNPDNLRCIVY
ncbi:hypothetical protein E3P99_01586 [Wallemia hederae]|uniref:F-box domain-containing protein n=1 Tax=Wallemia hederae TaxID=1540922 RepID=A0A4T0FPR4_9BASI|nr:hypothetical protein E3P99_01586 [Wallemia hederae]